MIGVGLNTIQNKNINFKLNIRFHSIFNNLDVFGYNTYYPEKMHFMDFILPTIATVGVSDFHINSGARNMIVSKKCEWRNCSSCSNVLALCQIHAIDN